MIEVRNLARSFGPHRVLDGVNLTIQTGESVMCHSLANIEHHHFKFEAHRRPGDVHIHFFGADAFSFGDGVELADGDIMEIELGGFGRPLRNPLRTDRTPQQLVSVQSL